jgi:hypothetical protein
MPKYFPGNSLLAATAAVLTVIACAKKEGAFFAGALGLYQDRVIITSETATAVTVTSYDLDGNLIAVLADYFAENNGPRGLALLDSLHVLLSLDGDDRIDAVYLGGGRSPFISMSALTGTIGKMVRHPSTGDLFVVESNTAIERFNSSGQRLPQTGNSFVQGAAFGCTPASFRALTINSSGQLVAVQSGTTNSFRYTIGPTNATGCSAQALSANTNDIINHSNGFMYYVTTTSNVYRASQTLTGSVSIFNNTGAINTPTALAELPNGDLIIASGATDTLEVISSGSPAVYRGSFAKNIHTALVRSILVVPGQ